MGKDPNCPICKLEFGIFRHRYPCAVCQGSFCDDCTPNKYVVPPNTSAESVCTRCEANLSSKIKTKDGGHRLGNGGANQGNPDNEREERARAAELRAQKQRGGTTHSKPPARGAVEPSQPNRAEKESNDLEAQGVPSGGRVLGGASESEQPMNPVLAAALKREQQAKRPDASPQMDPERKKLLAEIQAVLRQREEEEPFGLRALDATKMRIFLRDLTARGK